MASLRGNNIVFGPAALTGYLAKVGFTQRKAQRKIKRESQEPSRVRRSFVKQSLAYWILRYLGRGLGWLAEAAACLLYGAARIFLAVECFRALFRYEPGVFDVPPYFPHIM